MVEPASLIVDQLVGDTFLLVRHDFVDLVYTLLEMAACRYPAIFAFQECMSPDGRGHIMLAVLSTVVLDRRLDLTCNGS